MEQVRKYSPSFLPLIQLFEFDHIIVSMNTFFASRFKCLDWPDKLNFEINWIVLFIRASLGRKSLCSITLLVFVSLSLVENKLAI